MTVEEYIEELMEKEIISDGEEALEYISELRQEEGSRFNIVLDLLPESFDGGDGYIEIKINDIDNVDEDSTNTLLQGLICQKVKWMCDYDWGSGEEAITNFSVCLETYKKVDELLDKF